MTKKETEGLFFLGIIGVIIAAVVKFFETVGFIIPGIVLAVGVCIYLSVRHIKEKERLEAKKRYEEEQLQRQQQRKESLLAKYGDEEIVSKLMQQTIWVGQTDGQLTDSLGEPEDIDQKVLKTKKKEIWKYYHQSGNRYGLRVTLDNDVVVGWDEKL